MQVSTRISKSCQVVLGQLHSSPWLWLLSKISPVLLFLMIFGCLSLVGTTSSDSSCSHWFTVVPMIEARTMLTRTETRRVPARRFMAVHLRTGSAMTWSGHICVGTEVSGRDLVNIWCGWRSHRQSRQSSLNGGARPQKKGGGGSFPGREGANCLDYILMGKVRTSSSLPPAMALFLMTALLIQRAPRKKF